MIVFLVIVACLIYAFVSDHFDDDEPPYMY